MPDAFIARIIRLRQAELAAGREWVPPVTRPLAGETDPTASRWLGDRYPGEDEARINRAGRGYRDWRSAGCPVPGAHGEIR